MTDRAPDAGADDAPARRRHWQRVWTTRAPDEVSWYQPHAARSLALIRSSGVLRSDPVIDIGGGASTLIDDLIADGCSDLTVLDISAAALARSRARLGEAGQRVRWIDADVLDAAFAPGAYALWHDRAVFHFLTDPADRSRYVAQARRAVRPGGVLVIATFADDGPSRCSGLPVMRYSANALAAAFADGFELVESAKERHRTPSGAEQSFVHGRFRRSDA